MKLGTVSDYEFVARANGSDWLVRLEWIEATPQYKTVARAYMEEDAKQIAQALNEKHGY